MAALSAAFFMVAGSKAHKRLMLCGLNGLQPATCTQCVRPINRPRLTPFGQIGKVSG